MLDTLLDVLGELLGLGGKEPPPQRHPARRTQTQPPAPAPTQVAPDQLRQLRERMTERLREGKPARKPARRKTPEAESVPAPTPIAPIVAAEPISPHVPVEQAKQVVSSQNNKFIAALRSNPEAARQAFVYSEILGKPLADRGSSF